MWLCLSCVALCVLCYYALCCAVLCCAVCVCVSPRALVRPWCSDVPQRGSPARFETRAARGVRPKAEGGRHAAKRFAPGTPVSPANEALPAIRLVVPGRDL